MEEGMMGKQAIFDLTPALYEFVEQYAEYGFESEHALVCAALAAFQQELARTHLVDSAIRYAELYATDAELQALTEQAIEGWPD
jgi:hypothetical protein